MGSTVVDIKGTETMMHFGKKFSQTTYLQFVPGVCVEACTSVTNKAYMEGGESYINSITAMPHVGAKGLKRLSTIGDEHRYFPLLRGMVEVPTAGDPVLLCTFGGMQYYLGPLNTKNNVNWNPDKFVSDTISDKQIRKQVGSISNKSFLRKKVNRLHKEPIKDLDFPLNKDNPDDHISMNSSPDMIFEGRHGNSIRIGSRNINPYIVISNNRTGVVENAFAGSMMSFLTNGSIRQHYRFGVKEEDRLNYKTETGDWETGIETSGLNYKGAPDETPGKVYKFTLADDELETVHRSISKTYQKNIGRGLTETGEDDTNIEKTIYDYGSVEDPGEQIFLNSERVTINARQDSIFISSRKHIHLGSGNTMTFSTSNNFLFEGATSSIHNVPLFKINSEQAYLDGRKEIVLGNPLLDKGKLHSAVLGEYLQATLNSIIMDMKVLAGATARGIESRASAGESVATLNEIISGLDETAKLMNDTILSDIVSLK